MPLPKALTSDHTIESFLEVIHHKSGINTEVRETQDLETIIRTMWDLLTPTQCFRLSNDSHIKAILSQDNQPAPAGSYQGSMGGFGSEELETWQRLVHWPTP